MPRTGNQGGDTTTKRFDFHAGLGRHVEGHRKPNRKGKSRKPDALAEVTGHYRKSLLRLPGGRIGAFTGKRKPRGKKCSEQTLNVLHEIWVLAGCPSTGRPRAQTAFYLPHVRKHVAGCADEVLGQLREISARQMTRHLASRRRAHQRKQNGGTRRSRMLRHMVEVSTRRPEDPEPRLVALDTVAHCGDSTEDWLIRSLCVTDVKTGWVRVGPAAHAVPAFEGVLDRSPFPRGVCTATTAASSSTTAWSACASGGT